MLAGGYDNVAFGEIYDLELGGNVDTLVCGFFVHFTASFQARERTLVTFTLQLYYIIIKKQEDFATLGDFYKKILHFAQKAAAREFWVKKVSTDDLSVLFFGWFFSAFFVH